MFSFFFFFFFFQNQAVHVQPFLGLQKHAKFGRKKKGVLSLAMFTNNWIWQTNEWKSETSKYYLHVGSFWYLENICCVLSESFFTRMIDIHTVILKPPPPLEIYQESQQRCQWVPLKNSETRLGVPSIAGRLLKVIETCVNDLSLQTHTPLHYILGLSSQPLTPAKRWQNFEIWSRGTSCSNRCLWSLSNSTRFKKNS